MDHLTLTLSHTHTLFLSVKEYSDCMKNIIDLIDPDDLQTMLEGVAAKSNEESSGMEVEITGACSVLMVSYISGILKLIFNFLSFFVPSSSFGGA